MGAEVCNASRLDIAEFLAVVVRVARLGDCFERMRADVCAVHGGVFALTVVVLFLRRQTGDANAVGLGVRDALAVVVWIAWFRDGLQTVGADIRTIRSRVLALAVDVFLLGSEASDAYILDEGVRDWLAAVVRVVRLNHGRDCRWILRAGEAYNENSQQERQAARAGGEYL